MATPTGMNAIARKVTEATLKILMYHGVSSDDEPVTCWWQLKQSTFAKQIRYLTDHFNIVTMDQVHYLLSKKKTPKNTLALTFDDGYRNFLTHALPVLHAYNVPATLYVPTGPVDKNTLIWSDRLYYLLYQMDEECLDLSTFNLGVWRFHPKSDKICTIETIINRLKDMTAKDRSEITSHLLEYTDKGAGGDADNLFSLLTFDEIRELSEDKCVTIGSHAVSHQPLTTLPEDVVKMELDASKACLEEVTEKSIDHFCYPAGYYNQSTMDMVSACGYRTAVIAGKAYLPVYDCYEIPRIGVGGYDDDGFFKCQISGLVGLKDKLNIWLKD